ncbi:MAG TPA: uracil-DNA glycosylase [Candidatus Caccousia avicola]|uniref:Type-4 uracil-DNA glycosylase n=1 Tax=Candidatus Caccousia avicola TaxID=2840721 RepID=A0A9D1APG3_9FIRM|nr:uracil-DNA glycosylase [Candidatus Caccousia avicola]
MYQTWEELERDCLLCEKCPLREGRTQVVFGVGNRNAKVLFIGEGPGEQEDLQGKPFVGRSGQYLDKLLASVGLTREKDLYIGNIVKCRPPHNRDPLPEEQDACIDWLRAQTALIKPKIIVCLGRIAAMKIIRPDFKITKEHGVFYEKNGVLMMATLHPAALLRNPAAKPGALEDFVRLREKMEELGLVAPETFPDEPCP